MDSTAIDTPVATNALAQTSGDGIAEKPSLNGDFTSHDQEQASPAPAPANAPAFTENASLPAIATATTLKSQTESGPSPAQTSPSEDATSFIPSAHDAQTPAELVKHSHPTPPPDQPYEAAVQHDTLTDAQPAPIAAPAPLEPAVAPTGPIDEMPIQPIEAPVSAAQPVELPQIDPVIAQPKFEPELPAAPLPTPSLVRPREDDVEDEPSAKRSKVEDAPAEPAVKSEAPAINTDVAMADAPVSSIEPATPTAAPATSSATQHHSAPMTDLQKSFLIEKTKNLRKTKHATAFMVPVDIVKLNIPNYPNIVKQPMDLGTLENKLKNDQYNSAQEYADDFNLIVSNSRVFNGDAHAVTIAAFNMEAYFKKYMSNLPGPQDTAQPKTIKRASPVAPRPQPRREARQPPPAPASPATAQTFALQADGTPRIRRDSTTKRPHRTIKPPANRELSYAKPKRKEHQLELKFCEYVLDEIRGPKYGSFNHIFQAPVDPVALNIPHYRQVVKRPMDLSTMAQKLKTGQYAVADEFRQDFELMIENCLLFNPPGNPVRDIGVQFRREFAALWSEKQKWERANKKTSERASSDSEDSEEESEEDEEDDAKAAAQATIAALTKQLAELQKQMSTNVWGDGKKKKKDKKKEKKHSIGSAPKKPAAKAKAPKKVKPLSYDDKNEISNAVGLMDEGQVARLTQIITDNCEKYRNMGDDMELEIDDLPNHVQHLLLKHVRSIFGNPNKGNRAVSPDDLAAEDDDDYMLPARERAAAAAGGKRKKHKPMGKKEQQENIAELRQGSPTSASFNAAGMAADDTSGDEESEESEEE